MRGKRSGWQKGEVNGEETGRRKGRRAKTDGTDFDFVFLVSSRQQRKHQGRQAKGAAKLIWQRWRMCVE